MKQYKVTVNGQSYDVSVEEVGAASARLLPLLEFRPRLRLPPRFSMPPPRPR